MARIEKDGTGQERHLHGLRFAPKQPAANRRMLAVAPGIQLPDPVDVSLFDQIAIRDQGGVGKCTGAATSRLAGHVTLKLTGQVVVFSMDFPYAMTRKREGTPLMEDSGCAIPDALESLRLDGICREELWPSVDDDHYSLEPDDAAKADGQKHQGLLYYHCPDHHTIHAALAQQFGISIGITCFENMMSPEAARTGEVKYPEPGEKALGGHDIVIRSYDGSKKIGGEIGAYRCDNSWSSGWGLLGRFWLPKRYVDEGLATDAETLRAVETV